MISCSGLPRPKTRSAEVVTVERSTFSRVTGKVGVVSKVVRKAPGLMWARSFRVASKGNDMIDPPGRADFDRASHLLSLPQGCGVASEPLQSAGLSSFRPPGAAYPPCV